MTLGGPQRGVGVRHVEGVHLWLKKKKKKRKGGPCFRIRTGCQIGPSEPSYRQQHILYLLQDAQAYLDFVCFNILLFCRVPAVCYQANVS